MHDNGKSSQTMKKTIAAAVAAIALLGASAFSADAARAGIPATYNEFFDSHPMTVNGDYEPLLFACNVEGGDAFMLWYAAGPAMDHLWTIERSATETLQYTSAPMPINGVYDPIVGDFDGDGCDDILWYAAGTAADYIWWGGVDGFESQPLTINGTYEPVAGWFAETNHGIFWYSPGTGAEYVWSTGGTRTFTSKKTPAVNGTYRVASNHGAVLFHKPGAGTDHLWTELDGATGAVADSVPITINGTYEPSAGIEGFLLYAPGPANDHLFYDLDEEGNPETLPATINGTFETGERSPYFNSVHLWHAAGPANDYLWVPARMDTREAAAHSERGEFGQR